MNFIIVTMFVLFLLLILSVLGLHYFYKQKFKKPGLKNIGLAVFLILSVLATFGIIISISGEGITSEHALLLNGYTSDFYRTFNIEKIESNDYHFYLDSIDSDEFPNLVITVKKEGFLYHVVENDYVSYINDEGQRIGVLTYCLGDKYLHFLEFFPTYFEEIGYIGYYLPETVVINGEEVEVNLAYYCYSIDDINTLNVNCSDFRLN